MAAFQINAFQINAFQINIVASTGNLQLPINCVLIGEQLYERTGRTFERIPGKSASKAIARTGAGGRIGGETPSFTTKTDSRGYD